MKLLIDMNLSPRWVEALKAEGIQATHWSTVGSATALDEEIMSFALEEGYVILTHDLDFGAILAATRGRGPSVIQLRANDTNAGVAAPRLAVAIRQTAEDLLRGALLTVDTERQRIRLLPLL